MTLAAAAGRDLTRARQRGRKVRSDLAKDRYFTVTVTLDEVLPV